MLFEIKHETNYDYGQDVFLEPQTVRLTPRTDAHQRLVSFSLDMAPEPAGMSELVDLDGDRATVAWFSGTTRSLSLRTISQVETLRSNPFDFLWLGPRTLPMKYDAGIERALEQYTHWTHLVQVKALSEKLAAEAGDAQTFVSLLAASVHDAVTWTRRDRGDPLEPKETLARGEGSCRDLTVLYMDLARAAGFAARFVSGYLAGGEENDLHAWAELYLPGGGWRGFDPSTGLAVADQHIAVASAATPKGASPITGHYRGEPVPQAPQSSVTITPLPL